MSEMSFEQMLDESFKTIHNGEVVEGTVIDVKDDEAEIKSFWNEHLPICLSLKDGYSYYALCLKDGTIVTGEEPEFEETTEVAPSFRDFLQMLCNGELDLE